MGSVLLGISIVHAGFFGGEHKLALLYGKPLHVILSEAIMLFYHKLGVWIQQVENARC